MRIRTSRPVGAIINDYAVNNVTKAGGWFQLSASVPTDFSEIDCFDSSGSIMQLGIGPSGSEQPLPHYITPGGNTKAIQAQIGAGTRLVVRCYNEVNNPDATVGFIVLNCYQ